MDREGWPYGAVERAECANCGKHGYSRRYAPRDRGGSAFRQWVRDIWPWGDVMQTRWGLMVWCSPECRHVWMKGRERALKHQDGWAHQHQMEMDRRIVKSGVLS